jgi:uncharacterized membrane protein (UPF0127 family)
MDDVVELHNRTTGEALASLVIRRDNFFSRGRGLMFRRSLSPEEVHLFVLDRENISGATIHMFFVFFPISVIWLDAGRRVVDKALARPWRPYYAPSRPACYFVEGHPSLLDRVDVGDELDFAGGTA